MRKARAAERYGSCAITCSTSRPKGAIPVVGSTRPMRISLQSELPPRRRGALEVDLHGRASGGARARAAGLLRVPGGFIKRQRRLNPRGIESRRRGKLAPAAKEWSK